MAHKTAFRNKNIILNLHFHSILLTPIGLSHAHIPYIQILYLHCYLRPIQFTMYSFLHCSADVGNFYGEAVDAHSPQFLQTCNVSQSSLPVPLLNWWILFFPFSPLNNLHYLATIPRNKKSFCFASSDKLIRLRWLTFDPEPLQLHIHIDLFSL